MDTISNKLEDLKDDVDRRDAVSFRMHLHELRRRGLCDAELDAVTKASWSTGLDDDEWKLVPARLAAVTKAYENERGRR